MSIKVINKTVSRLGCTKLLQDQILNQIFRLPGCHYGLFLCFYSSLDLLENSLFLKQRIVHKISPVTTSLFRVHMKWNYSCFLYQNSIIIEGGWCMKYQKCFISLFLALVQRFPNCSGLFFFSFQRTAYLYIIKL